jgi:hypothetical protein
MIGARTQEIAMTDTDAPARVVAEEFDVSRAWVQAARTAAREFVNVLAIDMMIGHKLGQPAARLIPHEYREPEAVESFVAWVLAELARYEAFTVEQTRTVSGVLVVLTPQRTGKEAQQ